MLRGRHWSVLAAAVLVAAAVVFWRLQAEDAWGRFAAVVERAPARAVPGRFAGLDVHRPAHLTRSALKASAALDHVPELYDAADDVLASDADERQKAVATFLSGRREEAQRKLQALSASGSASAAVWNDLAVVLSASEAQDDTALVALAAVNRALEADPSHQAARFNHALIVEQLGLRPLAIVAWEKYLRLDGSSGWAAEANQRIARLRVDSGGATQSESASGAATSPQKARLAALNEVLPEWGRAVLRGDEDAAAKFLGDAAAIGEALRSRNDDRLIADVVATARSMTGEARLALASAHVEYAEAAALNLDRKIAPAAAKFAVVRAAFERASSPASLMATYFSAMTAVDRGERDEALQVLADLSSRAPVSYRVLHAQIDRLRGTIFFFEGLFADSMASYDRARIALFALGETQSAIDATSRLAAVVFALGRPAQAWATHRAAIEAAGETGDARLMQLALHSAAFVALEERRWDVAHAILDQEVAIENANPRVRAELILWRVLAANKAGLSRSANAGLADAREATASVTDPDFRKTAINDLRLLEAMLLEAEHPEQAHALLTEHFATARTLGRESRLPELLVRRAALRVRLGRGEEAEHDLREAIALIERRGARVERDLLRDSFLGRSSGAYDALADLLDRRGAFEDAVVALDGRRARILTDRRRVSVPVGAKLPVIRPGTALVSWGLFADRTVIYLLREDGLQRRESKPNAIAVERAAREFVEVVRRGSDQQARDEGRVLHEMLLAPVQELLGNVDNLLIVADSPLDEVPFAALVDRQGRHLIEGTALSMVPAIRGYAQVPSARSRGGAMVSVGDPRIDATRYASLAALPAAAEEATEIASLYADASLFVGKEATEARVLPAIERSAVIHIAAHAVADAKNPENSRILFASSPVAGADELTAGEIASLDLSKAGLVVLAGCRTAASLRAHGFVQNVSAAFLTAGAHHVIGSLWDIEDNATRTFSVALHQAVRRGVEPSQAVREAQLRMVGAYPIHVWSAMQLYTAE